MLLFAVLFSVVEAKPLGDLSQIICSFSKLQLRSVVKEMRTLFIYLCRSVPVVPNYT